VPSQDRPGPGQESSPGTIPLTWEQPKPGLLVWRVPSGRTYTTTPTEYQR